MVDRFVGSWQLMKSENFDEYMKEVGVGYALRKMIDVVKPVLNISVDDDGVIEIKSSSFFKTFRVQFKLNEEFDDLTFDGRNAKTVFTLENGKLVQKQTWDGNETTLEREIQGGQLLAKCVMGGVVALRTYEKAA